MSDIPLSARLDMHAIPRPSRDREAVLDRPVHRHRRDHRRHHARLPEILHAFGLPGS